MFLNPFTIVYDIIKYFSFNLGSAAAVVGIASGINSIMSSPSPGAGPAPASGTTAGGTIYDPFASYRPQFGGQLAGMMTPGTTFNTSDPSYQWRFGQGLEALNRTEAAKGMLGSGNRLVDLMNYGQGAGSTEYGAQFNRLASLAGVNQTSQSGYGSLMASNQQGGWNSLAQGMAGAGSIVNGISGLFGGGTGGGSIPMDYSGMNSSTGYNYSPLQWS